MWRTIDKISPAVLDRLVAQTAVVRRQMWHRMAGVIGTGTVVLDIDASLVEIHSERKEGTAATYKGGFGFAPMLCFADATGELLAGVLRPGNAAANTIADHLSVLDAAIDQLPEQIGVGHHDGDDKLAVRRSVQVRTDSAGCTHGFVAGAGPATSGSR